MDEDIIKLFRGDVYVARVTGAMCNCLPAGGETHNVSCQDYRLPQTPGSTVITAELTNRARCYAESGFYVYPLRVCSDLNTNITPEGMCLDTKNHLLTYTLAQISCPILPTFLCEISQISLLLVVECLILPHKWILRSECHYPP